MAQDPRNGLRIIQIGANTSDLPGTLRLFADAFGFENGGGNGIWGQTIGVQGLGPESRAMIWWMVGAQKFFQLEFFNHTKPMQRPKRKDWTPADHGWARFGVATSDFDRCLKALAADDIKTITSPITENGLRRVAFLEPYLMTIVEVFEKKKQGGEADKPEIVYAAASVSDIESARKFYRDTLGLEIANDNTLHTPQHEALWGLPGARRDTFIARGAGNIVFEVVQYHTPSGRPRAGDYRASDQGVVNVCLGSRDTNDIAQAMERAEKVGIKPPLVFKSEGILSGYLVDAEREIELGGVPEHLDAKLGFEPVGPFLG